VKQQKRSEAKRKLKEYYHGTWNGMPAASILYAMASQVNRDDNDSLWWAILALTDQWVHGKISRKDYDKVLMEFQQRVQRRYPDVEKSNGVSKGAIRCEEDYRFMLFRHWSLYESMYHSNYVASKLGIWKEKGRKRLANFLAKMG
jgi:cell division control protein 45